MRTQELRQPELKIGDQVEAVQDWFEELKERVPVRRVPLTEPVQPLMILSNSSE